MLYTGIRKIKDPQERKRVIEKLMLLRRQLDRDIPGKTATNTLLLATWNIRKLGDGRKTESLYYIAEIISRFDLVAVQEVLGNKKDLEKIMSYLGKNWSYIATDVTAGGSGAGECMAFLYDSNKVSFKNLAGEIVLPDNKLINGLQFARTPFCVSFQAGWFKFNLATVHIYYGTNSNNNKRRLSEIEALAKFLTGRAKSEKFNYVVLGDFNIPEVDGNYMKALETNGFHIPNDIKAHPTDLGGTYHYDQIAFNLQLSKTMTIFREKEQGSGAFNFCESVYTEKDMPVYRYLFPEEQLAEVNEAGESVAKSEEDILDYYLKTYRTHQMSDHLPLWVELKVDFSSQYLVDLDKEF